LQLSKVAYESLPEEDVVGAGVEAGAGVSDFAASGLLSFGVSELVGVEPADELEVEA
jgi:hypothetical protein